jgi:hypothetical protein
MMKPTTSPIRDLDLDPLNVLKRSKQQAIEEINRKYDPLIALAQSQALGPVVQSKPASPAAPESPKAPVSSAKSGYPKDATNAEAVLWAMQQNRGRATIAQILETLPADHPLRHRAIPGKAVSGLLAKLRESGDVEKGPEGDFATTK